MKTTKQLIIKTDGGYLKRSVRTKQTRPERPTVANEGFERFEKIFCFKWRRRDSEAGMVKHILQSRGIGDTGVVTGPWSMFFY